MAYTPSYEPHRFNPEALTPIVAAPKTIEKSVARPNDVTPMTMYAESADEPSFWDLLDVINPLQHIPIIGDIYREITGDKIGAGPRVIGGTLFGGAIGLGAAVANLVIEDATGDDLGGHAMAMFNDNPQAPTQFAEKPAAPASPIAEAPPTPAPGSVASAEPVQPQATTAATPLSAPPGPAPEAKPAAASASFLPLGFGGPAAEPQPIAQPVAQATMPIVVKAGPAAPQTAPIPLVGPQTASPANLTAIQEQALQPAARNAVAPAIHPLNRAALAQNRFMPLPPRPVATPAAMRDPAPPLAQPAAASAPTALVAPAGGPDAATAQRVLMEQGQTSHPLVPASGQAPGEAAPDWFAANMMKALDKYEQSHRLGAKP